MLSEGILKVISVTCKDFKEQSVRTVVVTEFAILVPFITAVAMVLDLVDEVLTC